MEMEKIFKTIDDAFKKEKEERKKEQLRRAANRWYHRHKNTEKYKKMHREYARKWVEKNKDKYNKYQREYKRKYRAKKNGDDITI